MDTKETRECNSENLLYFEANSMKELYKIMKDWQLKNKKRLLSLSIVKDLNKYCCISLTNPTEVIICDGKGSGNKAEVDRFNRLSIM